MGREAVMAEGTEIEDRVDFDDDNYIEEMDDLEEQIDDEGAGEGGSENNLDRPEDVRSEDSGKDQLQEVDGSEPDQAVISREPVEDEEKPAASIDEDEKAKHVELLSLPPHGSEIFIGGLPRNVAEEDLRDLCESLGEIFEVSSNAQER